MLRRLGIRLKGGQRNPRRPLTPAEHERRQRYWLLLATITLALTLWAILTVRPPNAPGLRPGLPSPVSIRANKAITYVSELRTEAARVQAESDQKNLVTKRDPKIPIDQRVQLDNLLQTISQIRDDPSLDRATELNRLAHLPNSTLLISQTLAEQIVALDPPQWDSVRRHSLDLYDRAMNKYNYEINEDDLIELRQRSLPYWSSFYTRNTQQTLPLIFSSAFLKANVLLDEKATNERKQAARNAVAPVTVQIQEGESIVRQGDPVTPDVQEKLAALGELQTTTDWPSIGGRGLFAALVATIFGIYLQLTQHEVWIRSRSLLVVIGMFALTVLAARVMFDLSVGSIWPYTFPLAATALLMAALFNSSLAFVASALLTLMIMFLGNSSFGLGATLFLSSLTGIFIIGRADRSLTFLLTGLAIGIVAALTQTALWLVTVTQLSPSELVLILIASGINGSISAILALGLYNLVGHMAGIATPFQLMELAHPSQPLLRKLIREAPGTYYHSVAVGNLAESAAEAIGADALLLRVAAYYHDIGKSIRPYFFTDNQSDRENVHNELDPSTSAEIIAEHVREGVNMARATGLPRQVVDFIPTHHGTTIISHFYQLALQQEDTVDVNDFRYPGPKPQTREQAILMLADSVEATVRSKAQNGKLAPSRSGQTGSNGRGQNSLQTLEELVNSIIDERIRSGQLDESPLTLRDITQIRQAFINALQGIYHPRVDYTPQIVKTS